jgi:SAM-dependent methyltransferase
VTRLQVCTEVLARLWEGLSQFPGSRRSWPIVEAPAYQRETVDVNDDDLLAEQRSFYRARAPEYDEWWQRRGRYDRGEEQLLEWQRQVAVVDDALASFGATDSILELAGGTGWWTERLARTARHLTVVDSSPEVLALNQERVGRPDVNYVVADLFDWQADSQYDVVFFSFWLSHVPRTRFGEFWSLVRSCLTPSGRAFLIDNRNDPEPETIASDPFVVHYDTDLHRRRLSDGSEYRVVKVMYEPDELQSLIEAESWTAKIQATRWFIFGSAHRS